MNKPILSICIATYNRKNHIERLIDYLQNEIRLVNNGDIEVIVSNNDSNDGTFEYLSEIDGKYEWLLISHNENNIGAYYNMNKLLHMAQGKYVWIPGDDDYLRNGLIKKILTILLKNDISYLYLSRRSINESNKDIEQEGKRHNVQYDQKIKVTHNQLVDLLIENFGDLKFQTSTILLTENALKYEQESHYFDENVQADCHSLFRAVRAMQEGESFFISDISVLNGNEISWYDSIVDIMSVCDGKFATGLCEFGFTIQECKRIYDRQLANAIAFYLTHKDVYKIWKERGKPSFEYKQLLIVFWLLLRKIFRLFNLSKRFVKVEVNFNDFIPEKDSIEL